MLMNTRIKQRNEMLVAQTEINEMCIKYFRYEHETEDETSYYGVCIRKQINDETIEEVSVNLSESIECADFIIRYLAKNTVTPVSAPEVIDYLYDLYFLEYTKNNSLANEF